MSLILELIRENFATSRADVEKALKKHFTTVGTNARRVDLRSVHVNDDGSVSVTGDVVMHPTTSSDKSKLKRLPVKFREVTGKFDCSHTALETLEGSPEAVGNFDCSVTKIKNMKGAPKLVKGWFLGHGLDLDSLEGMEDTVVGGDMSMSIQIEEDNSKLRSLKGAPLKIGGKFEFNSSELKTLEHLPKETDALHINGIRPDLPLLRIFLVKTKKVALKDVKNSSRINHAEDIINDNLKMGRVGASKASSELIDSGYEEHARA